MCRYNRNIHHKVKVQEKNLHLKDVTMIDPVTGWFEVAQYDNKKAINIVNLVETMWLYRYYIPI